MSIDTKGEVHEFQFNTGYFTVTAREFLYFSEHRRDAETWLEILPKAIKEELKKLGGGIIWWRINPEIDHENCLDGSTFWKGYVRFATSPELPEDFLTTLCESTDEIAKKMNEFRRAHGSKHPSAIAEDA
jgi:hypothetical protein